MPKVTTPMCTKKSLTERTGPPGGCKSITAPLSLWSAEY
jgi:hypothetical protein